MKTRWHNYQTECRYCHKKEITKDHIIPKSRGGRNVKSNFQPLCSVCNLNKNNLTDREIAEIFRNIKARGIWYRWEEKYARWLKTIEQNRHTPLLFDT